VTRETAAINAGRGANGAAGHPFLPEGPYWDLELPPIGAHPLPRREQATGMDADDPRRWAGRTVLAEAKMRYQHYQYPVAKNVATEP
jgi:hypothetical protein